METKTGLMYSELTGCIYWGTINTKTNIARTGKKDVTSDFIGVMLQKFPINHMQDIICNGKHEAVIMVLDEQKAAKYKAAPAMYDDIESDINFLHSIVDEIQGQFPDLCESILNVCSDKAFLLSKCRGESTEGE